MKLNQLPKITTKKKKRLGRGYGSGKGGHTVGRGQKGQKARSKVALLFEGTKRRKSLMGRLAMLRGKGKLKSHKNKSVIVNVKYLNLLDNGAVVDVNALVKAGIVDKKDAKKHGVKILGDGELEKKLAVQLPASKGAKEKIEKAGGKLEVPKGSPDVSGQLADLTGKKVSKKKVGVKRASPGHSVAKKASGRAKKKPKSNKKTTKTKK